MSSLPHLYYPQTAAQAKNELFLFCSAKQTSSPQGIPPHPFSLQRMGGQLPACRIFVPHLFLETNPCLPLPRLLVPPFLILFWGHHTPSRCPSGAPSRWPSGRGEYSFIWPPTRLPHPNRPVSPHPPRPQWRRTSPRKASWTRAGTGLTMATGYHLLEALLHKMR